MYFCFQILLAESIVHWIALNRGLDTRMHRAAIVTILIVSLCILCVSAYSVSGTSGNMNRDQFYFPDQAEYVKLAVRCPGDTILWPQNRRCYSIGEQGPCDFGRVLSFDRKLIKPYCKDAL